MGDATLSRMVSEGVSEVTLSEVWEYADIWKSLSEGQQDHQPWDEEVPKMPEE